VWSAKESLPKVKIEQEGVVRASPKSSSRKGQKSAKSRALRLLSAGGAKGVPVAGASRKADAGLKIGQHSKTRMVL